MQVSASFMKTPEGFDRRQTQENERAALEALVNYVAELGSGHEGGAVKSHADALRRSLCDVLDPNFT